MGVTEEEKCQLCGTPRGSHGDRRHEFVGPDQDAGAVIKPPPKREKPAQNSPQVLVAPMPDLVLRHALVRAGVITSAQLEEAERELTLGNSSNVPAH